MRSKIAQGVMVRSERGLRPRKPVLGEVWKGHIAVVARARRLAGILYAVLRDGTVYEPHPGPVAALPA